MWWTRVLVHDNGYENRWPKSLEEDIGEGFEERVGDKEYG